MLVCVAMSAVAGAKIKFDKFEHDYGTFSAKNGLQTCVFTFVNTGDKPLVITQAVASCGCTVPTYTKQPIQPGEKGELKAASKIATRIAADGIVAIMKEGDLTAMIEVNSETDFVAKNESFQEFVRNLLKTILATKPANLEALMASQYVEGGITVEEKVKEEIFKIGEKLSVRRFVLVEGLTATYIHGAGSIGVIVKFDTTDEVAAKPEFVEFGKDIAMQIAAANPSYLNREAVPAEAIENEKKILIAQMANDPKAANKPDAIKEKMATGRLGKFYKENCLVDQAFIKDGNMDVNAYVNATAKKLGGDIKIVEYTHFIKGEGLEKRVDDFAAEVAAAVKG